MVDTLSNTRLPKKMMGIAAAVIQWSQTITTTCFISRQLTQPRRRRQQEQKTIVLHALHVQFSFLTFRSLSATWNDLFCSCVDDVTIWWQMFNFVFLSLKRWFKFNSRIVRTHFASVFSLNNQEIIAETRSYRFSDDVLAAVDVVFA